MMAWRTVNRFFESGELSAIRKGGQFPHAGHDGVVRGALFEQDFGRGVAFSDDKSAGDFAAGHGGAFGSLVLAKRAAFCFQWTDKALRIARRANGGAEFHDGLVEVAGAARVDECSREFLNFAADGRFADGIVRFPSADAAEDALDISVDHGDMLAVGDAGDGGGGVGADAGELAQFGGGAGHDSEVLGDDGLRGLVEHAGATVVAESAPEGEDVLLMGGGQGLQRSGSVQGRPYSAR